MLILQASAVLLAADLVSGLVHWAEDTFFTESTPVIGPSVIAPNVEHHERPAAMLGKGYWDSNGQLLAIAAALVAGAAALGLLTWHVWLFALLAGNANQIHKWAHMPRRRVPAVVRGLQRIGLFQSVRHHARHHSGARNSHYCTTTDWLNPLLDRIRFWRALEWVTVPILGAPRRADLVR
ncbi:Kua-ubiquitin conjugating enzyme hybrid localization domain protein [Planctomycetes bacterium Pla163]|uniref:Kua-ubiquitin conjugating enzyme hybrid localization domain protein n=1 Tax=Rohdeia mirabilis TaxID=2528008 RepID=A0A518CX76_9BACT|nr:Kua-ubiquitin conjugating enzyme hybrid localization domain protein [Planctomycetes bacterium Pla163]